MKRKLRTKSSLPERVNGEKITNKIIPAKYSIIVNFHNIFLQQLIVL